ncbi:response regulator transcription factor [Sphaerochaeta sp.]|jgi:DNA-binding NarL/FixJ family response regulator|uniref:Transcriptional regulatory protein UhpA n=1 Tax=bioreactor metagenome TaxID=1076179 RepID=A0A644WJ00_9ZZZZ|nr:response regulator transcription factor [Sphaerochaeta sp.]MDD2394748.1 response regulator transcription factor [Sphaerochaeta sp.]MDD3456237.1 response regulator transcription factor [Sphaerochaeta sp.]MDD4039008.1 response regulator transcription factor [Sphaerochaeta sp.]MDX9985392.1 response regulator transcription factor [Sphaerochaeta sp.]
MISIAVVEDHALFRKGLISMLERESDIRVVSEYCDGREFLQSLEYDNLAAIDLIFLDIALPWKNGLEVLQELQQKIPDHPPVCILSMYPEVFYLKESKALGARGYLNKNVEYDVLKQAIDAILQGNTFFAKKESGKQQIGELENLSERELEVFKLLARGYTVKEIGFELKISIKSVSTYKSRLMQKLGVDSVLELYKLAVMH